MTHADFEDLKPVNDYLLLKKVEFEAKTDGGILLLDSDQKLAFGEVIDCGYDVPDNEKGFTYVGSTVVYDPLIADTLSFKGELFDLIRFVSVYAFTDRIRFDEEKLASV